MQTETPEAVLVVARKMAHLNAEELGVVDQIVDGLLRGRDVYGELAQRTDARDYLVEGIAEARDQAVYLAMQIQRLRALRDGGGQ
jgi:hypothetical protein